VLLPPAIILIIIPIGWLVRLNMFSIVVVF